MIWALGYIAEAVPKQSSVPSCLFITFQIYVSQVT